MDKKTAKETFDDEHVKTLSQKLKLEREKALQMEESVRIAKKEMIDVKKLARRTLQDLSNRENMLDKELKAKNALLDKKTDALVKANEIVSGLEQRLAFSRIDDPFILSNNLTTIDESGATKTERNNGQTLITVNKNTSASNMYIGSLLHRMDLSSNTSRNIDENFVVDNIHGSDARLKHELMHEKEKNQMYQSRCEELCKYTFKI